MPQSKLVRISSDTIQKLSEKAKPFESPNDCISRILTEHGTCSEQTETDKHESSDVEEEN